MNTHQRANTRADALATHRAIAHDGTLKDRVLHVLRTASRRDPASTKPRTLTDYELAATLGVERSSINAARNELVKEGLVTAAHKRYCRHRPSKQKVYTWRATTLDEYRAVAERAAAEVYSDFKRRQPDAPQPDLFGTPAPRPSMSSPNAH